MITFYSEKIHFRILELFLLAAICIQALCFFAIDKSLIFLLIFLSSIALMCLKNKCSCFHCSEEQRCAELSENRLLLIRRLIDHSYSYQHDKTLFYKKFCEEISIERLRKNSLLNSGERIRSLDIATKAIKRKQLEKLSSEDFDFLCLLNEGFTPRELSMIFGLTHPHSIYVKRHRIRARLEERKLEERKKERCPMIETAHSSSHQNIINDLSKALQ